MYKSKLYTILGILIIIFITYRTLILEREPYKINETVGIQMRLIVVFVVMTLTVVFIKILRELITQKFKDTTWISEITRILYTKPLNAVINKLLEIKLYQGFILKCGGVLWYTVKEYYHLYLVVFIVLIMPKIIVSTTLILDVILLHEMKVFYEIMWMFIMPYLFNGILESIIMYVKRLQDALPLKLINATTLRSTDINMTQKDFYDKQQLWEDYAAVLDRAFSIKLVQRKRIFLFLNLISTSLFLVGWLNYLSLVSSKPSYFIITDPFISFILQWLLNTIRIL
jgi:hypothetical protein